MLHTGSLNKCFYAVSFVTFYIMLLSFSLSDPSYQDYWMCVRNIRAPWSRVAAFWWDSPVIPPLSAPSVQGLFYLCNNRALSPDTPGPTVAVKAPAQCSNETKPHIFHDVVACVAHSNKWKQAHALIYYAGNQIMKLEVWASFWKCKQIQIFGK